MKKSTGGLGRGVNEDVVFRLPKLKGNEKKFLEGRKGLVKFLDAKNLIFNDDLVYSEEFPSSLNDAKLDLNVDKLPSRYSQIFKVFKQLSSHGLYGTISIIYHPIMVNQFTI